MKITKGDITKNKIIEESAKLFYKNGYTKTGISNILKACDIPKGSFYFYFKSKKDLALSICDFFEVSLKKWFIKRADNADFIQFIEGISEDMIKGKSEDIFFGCPLTTLADELSNSEPAISKYYYEALKKIKDLFLFIIKKSNINISEEKAEILADQMFALYEGYLVIFRISKDENVLINMRDNLICLYKLYS